MDWIDIFRLETDLFQLRVGVVVIESVVSPPLQVFDFVFFHAENENVVQTHFFGHFDVGTVQSSDGKSSVQLFYEEKIEWHHFNWNSNKPPYHKLHVASAGGFGTGSRDLFAQIGRRDDLFGQSDAIILQIDDFELIADDGIAVDHLANRANQFDDFLGHMIAGGSFSSDHDGPGHNGRPRIGFDAVVKCDDVQAVHQLALVLVNSLHLWLQENTGRIMH